MANKNYMYPHKHDLTSIVCVSATQEITDESRVDLINFKNIQDSFYINTGSSPSEEGLSFKTSQSLFDDLCIIEKQIQGEIQSRKNEVQQLADAIYDIVNMDVTRGKGIVQISRSGGLTFDNYGNLQIDASTIQPKLRDGVDIKTINGQSILGAGNIQVDNNFDQLKFEQVVEESSQNSEKISTILKQVSDMQDQIYMLKTTITSSTAFPSDSTSGSGSTIEGNVTNSQISGMQQNITDLQSMLVEIQNQMSQINSKIDNINSNPPSNPEKEPGTNVDTESVVQRTPPYKIHAFLVNTSGIDRYVEGTMKPTLVRSTLDEFKFLLSTGDGKIPYVMTENVFDCEKEWLDEQGVSSVTDGYNSTWVNGKLAKEIAKVPEDGLFIFYFCGKAEGGVLPKAILTEGYYVLPGGSQILPEQPYSTKLSFNDIWAKLKSCKGRILAIFDCSYSGNPLGLPSTGSLNNGIYTGYSSTIFDNPTDSLTPFRKDNPVYVQIPEEQIPEDVRIAIFSAASAETTCNYDSTRVFFTRALCDTWSNNNFINSINNKQDSMTYQNLFNLVVERYFDLTEQSNQTSSTCRPMCTFSEGFEPSKFLAFS